MPKEALFRLVTGAAELNSVEDVEGLRAKVEAEPLLQSKCFRQAHVLVERREVAHLRVQARSITKIPPMGCFGNALAFK